MTPEYFKVLHPDGSTTTGGPRRWPMDGTWTQTYTKPVLCERGWHLAKRNHLIEFIGYGSQIWVAEPAPDAIVREVVDKVCVSQARLVEQLPWNEQTARLFSADCAESALAYVNDGALKATLSETIRVVRAFANGLAAPSELSAARSAAWSAAWSAAESAAESAAWSAAWSAARSAQNTQLLKILGVR